jgi:superfamily II DNA/RNA helicase
MVRVCLAYGGVAVRHQSQDIAYGCDILVATAGRLCDFIGKQTVLLHRVRFLVLDEADRMLDMGFEPKMHEVNKVRQEEGGLC